MQASTVPLLCAQSRDAGQILAFHPFKEGAACCGHIAETLGHAGMFQRRHRVTPAGHTQRLARLGQIGGVLGNRRGGRIERCRLERAQRAIPNHRLAAVQPLVQLRDAGRADIEHHQVRGDCGDGNRVGFDPAASLPATTASIGSTISQPAALAFSMISRAASAMSFSHSEAPTSVPPAWRKVLAMPPPSTSTSTLATRLPSKSSLVEIFAPPTTAARGRAGASSALVRASNSAWHQTARRCGKQPRDRLGRCVSTVGGRKGVVHINIAEIRQALGKAGIVLLFLGMEAEVFQQQDLTVAKGRNRSRRGLADTIVREGDRASAESRLQRKHDRTQGVVQIPLPFRPPEMGHQHHFRALVGEFDYRRRQAVQARGVGDLPVLDRNVQIATNQHGLTGNIQVIKGLVSSHIGISCIHVVRRRKQAHSRTVWPARSTTMAKTSHNQGSVGLGIGRGPTIIANRARDHGYQPTHQGFWGTGNMPTLLDGVRYGLGQAARVGWFYGQARLSTRLARRLSPPETRPAPETEPEETPPASSDRKEPRKTALSDRELLTDVGRLFQRDWANVRAGIYPLPYDLRPDPVAAATGTLRYFRDLPSVLRRRRSDQFQDLDPEKTAGLPDYYLRNFHFQTDGYLSRRSARLYDYQVEILFGGAADVMRRQALPFIADYLKGRRPSECTLVDVATGTGRFLTFVRDAFPRLGLTGLDLSTAYLDEARRVTREFEPISWINAPAEAMPLADASVDLATCIYLFHELPPSARSEVAAQLARVLKPGGRAILVDSLQKGDRDGSMGC